MKMNEEMREEMWYIVDYALGTLKYYEKGDEHWKVTLSLLRHKLNEVMRDYKPLLEEE